VITWQDESFTGDIAWDRDEILDADILDGRVDGRDREIPFAEIASIEWESDRGARVQLRSGEVLEMRGSNDVDRDNRGIEVGDPDFGRAIVHWADFRRVDFHAPEAASRAEGALPRDSIRGTVRAADGRVIQGRIRWENSAVFGWQSVRGWSGDTEVQVELSAVAAVRKQDEETVEVETRQGRTFLLTLEEEETLYRGVFVTPEGRATRLIRWRDFDRMELAR
jgi:hypothetical protein